MDREQEELRRDIDRRREDIGHTVDEIEDRVRPSRVIARRRDRARQRMEGWKRSILGDDHAGGYATNGRETAHSAADGVREAPQAVLRRTEGNPLGLGAVALGAGWLIGSLLPETRREHRLTERMEPQLADTARAVTSEAKATAEDMKDSASEAAEHLKSSGRESAEHLKEEGRGAAHDVRDHSHS